MGCCGCRGSGLVCTNESLKKPESKSDACGSIFFSLSHSTAAAAASFSSCVPPIIPEGGRGEPDGSDFVDVLGMFSSKRSCVSRRAPLGTGESPNAFHSMCAPSVLMAFAVGGSQ